MPNLFPLQLEWLQAFMLVFTRVSATLAFMPVLGGQAIPGPMKAGLALLTTAVLIPGIDISHISVDVPAMAMALMVAGEALIGIVTAFVVNLMFAAIQLAGMIIDFQIGFGIVNVVDPITNAQVSVSGQMLNIFAMLTFLAMNGHHMVLNGMADSFNTIPLAGYTGDFSFGQVIINGMGSVYATGMQIAAPVTVTLLLKQAAMGLIARTVPQVNIFIVGFPITIALGIFTIALCLPALSKFLEKMFSDLQETIATLFYLMA